MSRRGDSYVQYAFDAVCEEAETAEGAFLTLYESVPFYGGPEEGGWWGSDCIIAAYQRFSTREQAEAAKGKVDELAQRLKADAKRDYGNQCRDELDWLEERGLEPDFLPEPDGPSDFFVVIESELGSHESRGCRHYE